MEQNSNELVSDVYSKLRTLETKNNLLSENLLAVNQNTIEEYRRINKEIEIINIDIKALKEEIFNLKQVIKNFLGEVDFFAKKNDIKILEKYINLWNPINFVTEEDVERIIEEKLERKKR